ncbi:tetratricopeptide repeat protein [Embleya sp. NPDC056575]|uniref:tetratricopeptide repeat protein n=1 Tax=unclassified Embleya TaxID=2699296 RepID=UPI0036A71401
MAIGMPDERRLPAGARRELVIAFHALYTDAGRPGTRAAANAISRREDLPSTVSHETLSALLHGKSVPDWPRLASVVRHFAGESVHHPDPDETVVRFHALWRAERDAPPSPRTDRLTVGALIGACRPDPTDAEAVLRETGLDPDTELSVGEAFTLLTDLGAQWHALRKELADAHTRITELRDELVRSAPTPTPIGNPDIDTPDDPAPAGTDTTRYNPIAARLPHLADTLSKMGLSLRDAGRHEDAATVFTEVVFLHRDLAEHDPTHRPLLAKSLSILGTELKHMRRHKDAANVYADAVAVTRDLAEHEPGHRPRLAKSLITLGTELKHMRRYEDAANVYADAVAVTRDLAEHDPAHRPRLAKSLFSLGTALNNVGRYNDAANVYADAVDVTRDLAEHDPTYHSDLANSLDMLALTLHSLGRHQEAANVLTEVVAIRHDLTEGNPGHRLGLANSLERLASTLGSMLRHQEAANVLTEVVAIRRNLAEQHPTHRNRLANTLDKLSTTLHSLGRPEEATAAQEEAVTLREDM